MMKSKTFYLGSIKFNNLPSNGGSGGGAGLNQYQALKGIPSDTSSKFNYGFDFVNNEDDYGGDGGSALLNSEGYIELITNAEHIVGKGEKGNTDVIYFTEIKSNYGNGGEGNTQGVIIVTILYEAPQKAFNGYTHWNK